MNLPHELTINLLKNHTHEDLNRNSLIVGVHKAREKTIRLLNDIKQNLYLGINEVNARKLALQIAYDHGVKKHWHQPYIRFCCGTSLSFHEPLQQNNILKIDEPYYIDIGPVWIDQKLNIEYEGDYGDTFIWGENLEVEKCIQFTKDLFLRAKKKWIEEKFTGEQIYHFIKQHTQENGYLLMEDFDGHRISDFPHHKYTKVRLARLDSKPCDSFWILELQINDSKGRFGAFFEDILTNYNMEI